MRQNGFYLKVKKKLFKELRNESFNFFLLLKLNTVVTNMSELKWTNTRHVQKISSISFDIIQSNFYIYAVNMESELN